MSYLVDGYHGENTVASAPVSERVAFIRRTYAHLAAALLVFVAIEAFLLTSGIGEQLFKAIFAGGGKAAWIGLMILFIGGGIAHR